MKGLCQCGYIHVLVVYAVQMLAVLRICCTGTCWVLPATKYTWYKRTETVISVAATATSESTEAPAAAETTQSPVVINVSAGQVVQAVQTSQGIMLLTSEPKSATTTVPGSVTQVLTATITDQTAPTDQPSEPTADSEDKQQVRQINTIYPCLPLLWLSVAVDFTIR